MAKADRWGPHPCSIEGCSERRVSRGLCSLHYARLLRLGDPWVQSVRTEDRPDLLSVRRPGFARYKGAAVDTLGEGCAGSTTTAGDDRPIAKQTGNPLALEGRGVSALPGTDLGALWEGAKPGPAKPNALRRGKSLRRLRVAWRLAEVWFTHAGARGVAQTGHLHRAFFGSY